MAKLDKSAIKKLSKLCRIHLNEQEEEQLLRDLQGILAYVEQMNEIETHDVPPCNQVLAELVNVMREDEVGDVMPREEFLENAPSQIGGMIRVPPVMKS